MATLRSALHAIWSQATAHPGTVVLVAAILFYVYSVVRRATFDATHLR